MKIEQLYTNCLAQAAYYIESNGEVAIIDPIRDYGIYLEKASENGASIKYIFETHFHADFVSGHIDLAKASGATIIYGPETETQYPVHIASDGETFKLGNISIKVIHTPGHTPESSCFLLTDENGKEHCLFTGDTLFVGDVGRPDLLDGKVTKEELAGRLYDSLNKIKTLPDEVIVYPAHGPGSACGKNIGKETFSTMGIQKQSNYALQPMSKETFIETVTSGIAPAPAYFFEDAKLNKTGYPGFDEVIAKGNQALNIEAFKTHTKSEGVVIIDSRLPDFFELGFIPGSLNFGLNGQYAIWAANILPLSTKIVLVCKPGTEEESVSRLTRVGFHNILGYLNGGFDTWKQAGEKYDMVISISPEELVLDSLHNPKAIVLDVRKPTEFEAGHLSGATNIQLADINTRQSNLNKSDEILIHCAGGYRSMVAASLLKKEGFMNIKNVWGGFAKIAEEPKAVIVKS